MRLGVVQMDCVEGDPDRNRRTVRDAVARAGSIGCDMLALPELWCSGYDLGSATCEQHDDEMFPWLVELSKEMPLLGGTLLESHDRKHRNCAVAAASGRELNRYRKQHSFRPLDEHLYLHGGTEAPSVFTIAGLRVAFTICYDLRFPEMYVPLVARGAELICIPAQWPRARIAHWRALLIARAIECQCYVLGVNRCGWFQDLEFPGHSLVVDPKGEIMLDCGEGLGLFSVDIDPREVHEWRAEFPVDRDR